MAVTAPELVSIPAGPFVMGAEDGDENERPEHPVFLEAYALGVAPVTQAEYARFIRDTGWRPPGVWELPSIVRPARAEEFKRLAARDEIAVSKANYTSAPGQRAARGTMPCRSYPPNGLAAFDMAGNAWNWVSDWYRADYYAVGEERNPAGPASGTLRVVRGGAWTNDDVAYLRCACRHPVPPDTYSYSIGFRVACAD